jgi:ATP-dependent Clp protease adapter protein ClpS
MVHAHEHGEAIIEEYCQEHAEYYKEALTNSGLVCEIFPVDE